MNICFFLVFRCSFCLFFFFFCILSRLLCSITNTHILLHTCCQQFSCVSGWVHDKRLVSLCCEWLRPSDTLRGLSNHYIVIMTLRTASVLSSGRRGFMVPLCVEISWTCLGSWKDVLFVASLTSCCRCCSLIWLCCRILYGFNAVLLCNGRFWDGFTSDILALLRQVTSREHP